MGVFNNRLVRSGSGILSSSSDATDLTSSFSNLSVSAKVNAVSALLKTGNGELSPESVRKFESDSDRLVSSIKTANHIARGDVHSAGMKAIAELLGNSEGSEISYNWSVQRATRLQKNTRKIMFIL
ncbi:MAG: hypothetical protein LBI56_02060 [Puniceicoccales bacterium]|jgi:hypothetical protein|nr:hypothetical protein [Puniceicoccales bacterium]